MSTVIATASVATVILAAAASLESALSAYDRAKGASARASARAEAETALDTLQQKLIAVSDELQSDEDHAAVATAEDLVANAEERLAEGEQPLESAEDILTKPLSVERAGARITVYPVASVVDARGNVREKPRSAPYAAPKSGGRGITLDSLTSGVDNLLLALLIMADEESVRFRTDSENADPVKAACETIRAALTRAEQYRDNSQARRDARARGRDRVKIEREAKKELDAQKPNTREADALAAQIALAEREAAEKAEALEALRKRAAPATARAGAVPSARATAHNLGTQILRGGAVSARRGLTR